MQILYTTHLLIQLNSCKNLQYVTNNIRKRNKRTKNNFIPFTKPHIEWKQKPQQYDGNNFAVSNLKMIKKKQNLITFNCCLIISFISFLFLEGLLGIFLLLCFSFSLIFKSWLMPYFCLFQTQICIYELYDEKFSFCLLIFIMHILMQTKIWWEEQVETIKEKWGFLNLNLSRGIFNNYFKYNREVY